jgi:diguanylate cyclase (GGDEF) domain
MKVFQHVEHNLKRWNRYILSMLGVIVLLSAAVETYYLLFLTDNQVSYFRIHVLEPTILLICVYAISLAAVRGLPQHQEYILLSSATLMVDILVVNHRPDSYLMIALHFPVLLSLIYYQLSKLFYSILNSMVSFVAIIALDPSFWLQIGSETVIAIAAMLLVFDGVAVIILLRGSEIRDHFNVEWQSEQSKVIDSFLEELRNKTDPLTGAYNHSAFHDHLDQMIRQSDSGLVLFYLAYLDIDNFQAWNERHGYRFGDDVLRTISTLISTRIGPHDLLARFQGDRFAIQSLHHSHQEAFDTMESIRRKIEHFSFASMEGERLTVSVGIVPYSMGQGKSALLVNADLALAEAKSKGKNRTAISAVLHSVEF